MYGFIYYVRYLCMSVVLSYGICYFFLYLVRYVVILLLL